MELFRREDVGRGGAMRGSQLIFDPIDTTDKYTIPMSV